MAWDFGKHPSSGLADPEDEKSNGFSDPAGRGKAFDRVTDRQRLDALFEPASGKSESDAVSDGAGTRDYAALVGAVYAGHLKALELLLDAGADVNSSNHLGITVLMLAAAGGMPGVVELLLEKGADPDATDISGRTALMWAAAEGNLEIVTLLVRRSANVNAQDRSGQTALILACKNSRPGVLDALLKAGAARTIRDNCGDTAYTWAETNGFAELLK